MADHWQDESDLKAQIVDDDDAPDDWEAEADEKPKASEAERKSVTTNKPTKKKSEGDKESQKVIKQPDGDYTPEQLDAIKQKGVLSEEHEKLNMAAELVDKDGKLRSLDDLDLYTREEFLNYSLRLYNHLKVVSDSEFYPAFIDHFLEGITSSMSTDGVKRVAVSLQAITLRKQSDERARKSKSKTKKQAKPQLRTGRQSDYSAFSAEGDHDYEYDDDD